jgi:hypothetical protein
MRDTEGLRVARRHPRAVAVSWIVVIVLLVLATFTIIQAFQIFGGNFAIAGTGAQVWLGLSVGSLFFALFALWDLIYAIGAGEHIVFRPVSNTQHFLARHRPRWLRIILNWAPVGAVGLGVLSGYKWFT